MRIAIAGASGNLGVLLSRFLSDQHHELILLTHRRQIPAELSSRQRIEVRRIDLGDPQSLRGSCDSADCVVSLAGVLFRGGAEKFLPITNTQYVINLVNEAVFAQVKKFVLLSFPHVEGESFPESPAKGVLPEMDPMPIHAWTRLKAERYLIRTCESSTLRYLIFRSGVVYGSGVKLIEAARKLMKLGLLAIWREPTWVHLLALPDFLEILQFGIEDLQIQGIVNIADDSPILLQDFLDRLAKYWGYSRPFHLPRNLFVAAAKSFDLLSRIFRCAIPLNPDILRMAMTSAVADTDRLKSELRYRLRYPTIAEGLKLC